MGLSLLLCLSAARGLMYNTKFFLKMFSLDLAWVADHPRGHVVTDGSGVFAAASKQARLPDADRHALASAVELQCGASRCMIGSVRNLCISDVCIGICVGACARFLLHVHMDV